MLREISFAVVTISLAELFAPSTADAQLAFNVGMVSDYRYRGISQSRLGPAVQAGVDYVRGGWYVGSWTTTIEWVRDGGGNAAVEIDFSGGYRGEVRTGLGYDIGVLAYQYPDNALEPNVNTSEAYFALILGPVVAKYSHCVSDLFGFAHSKGSGYLDASATFGVGGFTVVPHVGRQAVRRLAEASYSDYSLAIGKEWMRVVWSATLVGTNTNAYTGEGKQNLGRGGLVLGARYGF